MDILEIVLILVVLVAALWVKNKLLSSEMPKNTGSSPHHGASKVQHADSATTKTTANETHSLNKDAVAAETVDQTLVKQPPNKAESLQIAESDVTTNTQIPEDSVLRRHFLAQLHAEIESELFDRPTDVVLKRHYDQLILTKLADRLTGTSA